MLVLFTDTDTDLTPAEAAHYGYHLISMPYSIDCETVYPFDSENEPELKSFYNTLRKGVIPTTSAISPERYKQYFEPVFAAGNDILYVHSVTDMLHVMHSLCKHHLLSPYHLLLDRSLPTR